MADIVNRLIQKSKSASKSVRCASVIVHITVNLDSVGTPVWWSMSRCEPIEPHYHGVIPSIPDWKQCLNDISARGQGIHKMSLVISDGKPVKWLDIP